IAAARADGLDVTCEVTPHHLFLTEDDARRLGPYGHVKPPLASERDRQALWDHLAVVDCIATDHAPHTRQEKESPNPPPGMPGLETALPLMLRAVYEGRLDLDDLVAKMHIHPARIFGLPIPPETYIEVDTDAVYAFPAEGWHTRAGWSPFSGMPARGRVRRVVLRGREVFRDGRILAPPGSGRVLNPVPLS
ncbi:MAG: hypothetical protein NZP34_05310, partial [Caldilineales bacterium]|nr:hypothetical protein [Caldilineales bacterium]